MKSELKCEICGESHPACLDFHHKDSSQKLYELSRLCSRGVSIQSIKNEIEKCSVLCANCHRKLHWADPTGAFSEPSKPKQCKVCGETENLVEGKRLCQIHYNEHQRLVMRARRNS